VNILLVIMIVNGFVREIMTSWYDEDFVVAISRVYRVVFVDGQVLDFVVEVSIVIKSVRSPQQNLRI